MTTKCPICQKDVDEDIRQVCQAAEDWVVQTIRRNHPAWIEKDGSCSKCLEYYKKLGPSEDENSAR